jgi:hypothetical protein
MKFLKNKGFSDEEISLIIDKYDEQTISNFSLISDNVEEVIDYLREFGIKNVNKLILDRIDIFFIPVFKLNEIFSHYDSEYIIEILDNDPSRFDELD